MIAALKTVLPRAPVEWLEALVHGAERWGIHGLRFAAFAGQLAHESAEFTRLEENLNYSAERLMAVWPKRFPTLERAKAYARAPEKLANNVYANRMGNGSEESGDGWYYRGRGPLQLTGFDNHKKYGEIIGVDLVARPEKLLVPTIGIAAAGAFWQGHGLNTLADLEDHAAITQIINGGDLGLKQRIELTNKIRSVL